MKGIELITLAYVMIAIVAVFLFIHLFSTQMPDVTTSIYCQLHQAANAIIFLTTKPPMPPECGLDTSTIRETLASENELAELVLDCWKKGQEGMYGTTFTCYELYWNGDEITELSLTVLLIQKDYCKTLPNNFLDLEATSTKCGDENKIKWESDLTAEPNMIWIIKYDAFLKTIVVK